MIQFVELDGARVAYRVDGEGPPLLLVSGTGGDLNSNWDHLMPALIGRRTVLRVDYSGSGHTQDDGGVLTLATLASQVMAAATANGFESFDLLGYSLGGAVASAIAAEGKGQVRSLMLLAPLVNGSEPRLQLQFDIWQQLIRTDPVTFARLVLLNGFSPRFLRQFTHEQIAQWTELICASNHWGGLLRQVELDSRIDIRCDLPKISARTLVVGGAQDFVLGSNQAAQAAALVPGAQYTELDAGHMMPFECPEDLLDVIEKFLTST